MMDVVDESSFQGQPVTPDGQQTDQFSCSEDEIDEEEDEEEDDEEEEEEGVNFVNAIDDSSEQDFKAEVENVSLASTSGIYTPVTSEATTILAGPSSGTALQMALPLTGITPNLASGQELVIISPDGGIMKLPESLQPKGGIRSFTTVDDDDPDAKRILIEQDGQTYILTVQGGISSGLDLTQTGNAPSTITTSELPESEEEGGGAQNDINQAWFTSREDKSNLHNKGHVWKQGMWSKEEIDLLETNIMMYCEVRGVSDPSLVIFEMTKDERKDFYRSIAKGLNRPLFSVYRRVIRMYDNKNHVGKYTTEELEKLKKLRAVYGNDWQSIGSALGRSASSIKDRCRLMKDNCNQGKWFPEEERRLAEAVYELAQAVPGEMISSGLSWALVAERVGTRSEKQCRTKWLNYLNWKEAQGTDWTREDDITLICRVYGLDVSDENNVDWTELSKNWPSVRSPQWLRGKWWALKRHVPNSNDCPFQEICEFLFRNQVQKIRLKEEEPPPPPNPCNTMTARSIPINILRRGAQTLLGRTPALSCPQTTTAGIATQQGSIQTSIIPTLTSSMTGLLGDLGVSASGTPLVATSGGVPLLQTLEVLGTTHQGLHLASNHPGGQTTFLVTQPNIPLTTSHGQIIIQTLSPEDLHLNESMSVQLGNPATTQLIISSGGHTMSALGGQEAHLGTMGGSPCPPSPSAGQDDELHVSINHHQGHVALLDHVAYVHHLNHGIEEEEKSLIMADPMLASHSPEMLNTELESREGPES